MTPAAETIAPATPRFTECVSTGEDEGRLDARGMAQRLQELIEQIQAQPNPAARVLLQDCLRSLLGLYGNGLSRILAHVQDSGAGGQEVLERILRDPAVSGLLLIHGLHPVPLQARLEGALDKVRPYLRSHGGNIELLSLEGDVARVKLQGTCQGCPSSAVTLELAVRRAVEDACPDLMGFEVLEPASTKAK